MQWFRFYTEAVSDKKLRRIARDNGESMAHVLGVWTIVLSMASDSPVRGTLLISDDVPATIDDISDAAGCNVTETFLKLLVTGLVTVGVTNDGHKVYSVPAWDKRQFESDSSATRVKRHRERKKAAKKGENVTPVKRYSNAPDTDTDTDTEGDNLPFSDPPVSPSKPKDKPKPVPKEPNQAQQEMFGAICEVCELNPKINAARTGKAARDLLSAGYTVEQVRGFREWWLSDSWRAEHMPVPTIAKLIEKMEQFKNAASRPPRLVPANGHANGNGYGGSKVDRSLANAAALREKLERGGTL